MQCGHCVPDAALVQNKEGGGGKKKRGNRAVVGSYSPAVGVQRSEDSGPGVHVLQHGSLFGACCGIAPRQLAELSREAMLNVQGLGIALSSLFLLQRLHLYMFSQLHLGFNTVYVHTG